MSVHPHAHSLPSAIAAGDTQLARHLLEFVCVAPTAADLELAVAARAPAELCALLRAHLEPVREHRGGRPLLQHARAQRHHHHRAGAGGGSGTGEGERDAALAAQRESPPPPPPLTLTLRSPLLLGEEEEGTAATTAAAAADVKAASPTAPRPATATSTTMTTGSGGASSGARDSDAHGEDAVLTAAELAAPRCHVAGESAAHRSGGGASPPGACSCCQSDIAHCGIATPDLTALRGGSAPYW